MTPTPKKKCTLVLCGEVGLSGCAASNLLVGAGAQEPGVGGEDMLGD